MEITGMICSLLTIVSFFGAPAGTVASSGSGQQPPLPMPRVHLMPRSGFDSEPAYISSVVQRINKLTAQADSSSSSMVRVESWLAAANMALAHRLEPACSRRLIGIDSPSGDDPDTLRAVFAETHQLLSNAAEEIAKLVNNDDLEEGWLATAERQRIALSALAGALKASLSSEADAGGLAERRRAASALSRVLEHPDPAVVEAATLWQAYLRSRNGEPGRVMSLLPLALADPPAERMPYAFFTRVLRCQVLTRRGWYATSLAMLMQLEQRSVDWVDDDARREAATHTLELVRLRTLAAWHAELSDPARADQRQWCADQMAALAEQTFGDASQTVARLSLAIPIIAQPPTPAEPDPDPDGS